MTTTREVQQILRTISEGRALHDSHTCEQVKRVLDDPAEMRLWAAHLLAWANRTNPDSKYELYISWGPKP